METDIDTATLRTIDLYGEYGIKDNKIADLSVGQDYDTFCKCDESRTKNKGKVKPMNVKREKYDLVAYRCNHCKTNKGRINIPALIHRYKTGGKLKVIGGGKDPLSGLGKFSTKSEVREIEVPEDGFNLPDMSLVKPLTDKGKSYLMDKRGLSETTISAFKIASFFKPTEKDPSITYENIAMPYYLNGELYRFKLRSPDPARKGYFIEPKGGKPTMFNADMVREYLEDETNPKVVIFTEAEIDVMSLYEAGYRNAMCLPVGAPETASFDLSNRLFSPMLECGWLESVEKVILFTDNEVPNPKTGALPGEALAQELAFRFGSSKCFRANFTGLKGKDVNDILLEHKIEGVKQAVENAKPCGYDVGNESEYKMKPKPKKTPEESKASHYLKIAKSFFDERPNIVQLKREQFSKSVHCYAEFIEGQGWIAINTNDFNNAVGSYLQTYFPEISSVKARAEVIMNLNAMYGDMIDEKEFNTSISSIPLAEGNRSVCLTSPVQVIDTPKDDQMLFRLPVYESELPKDDADFEKGLFNKLLGEWFLVKDASGKKVRDEEKIEALQILVGQALIGNPASHFLFLTGAGGTGKSSFIKCIEEAMDDMYATTMPKEFLLDMYGKYESHPTGLMKLYHARLAFAGETPDRCTLNMDIIKTITSGDTIAARPMRQDFVEFKPLAMPILYGNGIPGLPRGTDKKSVERRIRLVKFNESQRGGGKKINLNDKSVIVSMRGEVLYWILRGLEKFMKLPIDQQNELPLDMSQTIKDDTEEYLEVEDTFLLALEAVLVEDTSGAISMKEIHKLLVAYDESIYGGKRCSSEVVGKNIRNMHSEKYQTKRRSDGNFLLGFSGHPDYVSKVNDADGKFSFAPPKHETEPLPDDSFPDPDEIPTD